MSRLVICEILGLSVNTLTAVNKSSLHNSRNLQQPIQIKYPTNENIFHIFFPSLKSTSSFEHFLQKDDSRSLCISEITFAKDVVR